MKKYFEANSILKKVLLLTAGVLALAVMIVALINAGKPTIVLANTASVAAPTNKIEVKKRPEAIKQEEVAKTEEEAEEEAAEEADVALIVEDELDYDDGSGITLLYEDEYDVCDTRLSAHLGALYFNGHKETYYSENVLPGNGLDIPGRHVAVDGTIRDEDGYICVAADPEFLPYGSTVLTTLGPGKVYDCGCAYGTVDLYVNW